MTHTTNDSAISAALEQIIEMRKVNDVLKELCSFEVTSTQVSRAAGLQDEQLERWCNRSLGYTPFVRLDVRYEKVRHGVSVINCAVLMATDVTVEGRRSVLGVSAFLTEAETNKSGRGQ